MKIRIAALVAVAALTASSFASAEEPARAPGTAPAPSAPSTPPSTGAGAGVAGSVFAVAGAASLLATPFCVLSDDDVTRRRCVAGAAITGVVFLIVGMPLLSHAVSQRDAYKEWQAAHPGLAGLGFSPGKNASFLTWQARF